MIDDEIKVFSDEHGPREYTRADDSMIAISQQGTLIAMVPITKEKTRFRYVEITYQQVVNLVIAHAARIAAGWKPE